MDNHNSSPCVSVIVPAFNSALFITDALNSVFTQQITDMEIIVIDDGSTDDTVNELTNFSDRLQVVTQENAGPAAARNRGLQLAHGEFVLFLDADDLILPGKLAEQVAILRKRPFLGAIHSGWQIIDESGAIIQTIQPWHDAPQLDLLTWLQWKPVRLGATLFRREWLNRINGFDETLRQSEDVDLMLRLVLAGCQIEWLKKPTLQYRHHAHSTVREGALQQAEAAVSVLDKFFARSDVPFNIRLKERQLRYFSLLWVAWHLHQTGHLLEMVPYLRQAVALRVMERPLMVLGWALQFEKWSNIDGASTTQRPELLSRFADAADIDADTHAQILYELQWWTAVWQHYVFADRERAITGWAAFEERPLSELISMTYRSILVSAYPVSKTAVHQFWQDLIMMRPEAVQHGHLQVPLYLALTIHSILRARQLIGLKTAVRYSLSLRALPYWGQTIRLIFNYIGLALRTKKTK